MEILPGSVWSADTPSKSEQTYNVYVLRVIDGGTEFETVIYAFSRNSWAGIPWSLPGKEFRTYYQPDLPPE